MRADMGSARSCLYMRRTSLAALLTNRSTFSSVRIASRHSLKKCPDPVSAHPQRGVSTFTMTRNPALTRNNDGRTRRIVTYGGAHRHMVGRAENEGRGAARSQEARKRRVDDPVLDQ